MTIDSFCNLIEKLFRKHGLNGEWKWKISNTQRRLGSCSRKTKTIRVSRVAILGEEDEIVQDVILHEMAHALLDRKPGDMPHGHKWKRKCVEIGAIPRSYGLYGLRIRARRKPPPRWKRYV